MKSFILALLLVCSTVFAQVLVQPEQANNNRGQSFFRLHNNSSFYVSCYYRDNYNFMTFSIAPGSVSMWYPVYGVYVWECQ